jgi:hypothetical protein
MGGQWLHEFAFMMICDTKKLVRVISRSDLPFGVCFYCTPSVYVMLLSFHGTVAPDAFEIAGNEIEKA